MLGKQRQLNPWGLLARQPNRWAQVSETVWKVMVPEEQHLRLSSYVCMHTHKLTHSCVVFFWNPKGKGSRQTLGWTIPWACWKGGPSDVSLVAVLLPHRLLWRTSMEDSQVCPLWLSSQPFRWVFGICAFCWVRVLRSTLPWTWNQLWWTGPQTDR